MKKSIIIVIVLIVLGGVVWYVRGGAGAPSDAASDTSTNPTSIQKEAGGLSEYKNEELGFAIKYPTSWTVEASASGIMMTVPTKGDGVAENTLNKLQVSADVLPGACSFPQVTTVSERSSIKVGNSVFNMISMSNSVQGRTYFNRMYSTSQGSVCYMFNFASITSNPANKGYGADQLAAVTTANKSLTDTADKAFQNVVKSFTFVSTPDGDNEALHSTGKK